MFIVLNRLVLVLDWLMGFLVWCKWNIVILFWEYEWDFLKIVWFRYISIISIIMMKICFSNICLNMYVYVYVYVIVDNIW